LGLVACDSAGGQTLDLEGAINPTMRYWAQIDYRTTLNDESCLSLDAPAGRWVRKVESRMVKPRIDGSRHALSTGLGRPGGAGKCGWRAESIDICVGPHDAKVAAATCNPLFVLNEYAGPAPTSLFLACAPGTWRCRTLDGRSPAAEVKSFEGRLRLDLTTASGGMSGG
jgi:hypothetical protein